jgi:hypothetical protein
MIPTEGSMVPVSDPDPCAVTGCAMVSEPVETCRDHRCPHRWQREGREDRQRREAKDALRNGREE